MGGRWASAAGVQTRRTAVPPIISAEKKPGGIIHDVSRMPFLFTKTFLVPPDVRLAIELLEQPIDHIRARRRFVSSFIWRYGGKFTMQLDRRTRRFSLHWSLAFLSQALHNGVTFGEEQSRTTHRRGPLKTSSQEPYVRR